MHGADEDDVLEQGGAPLRLPDWVRRPRRPRWLPARGGRPSRGAAILGVAGLAVGLAAGYAVGYRHLGQAVRPERAATAAAAVPSPLAGFAALVYPPPPPRGGPVSYSSNFGIAVQSGLGQTGGACSVRRGRELQVGVEVINLSETAVTLGQARVVLPRGGLHLISQQWAPCGALAPSWQAADGGMIVSVTSSAGVVEVGSSTPGSAAVLPPDGTAWLSATFQMLATCPSPLPVQFSVGYQDNGRTGTAELAGFPDLGQVARTGCKGSS
jgi:hypothetical protein